MVRWRQRTIFTSYTYRKTAHLSSLCLSSSNSTLSDSMNPIHYWPHKAVRYHLLRPLISELQADLFTTRWPWLFGVHSSYPNFFLTAEWYAVTSLFFPQSIDMTCCMKRWAAVHPPLCVCHWIVLFPTPSCLSFPGEVTTYFFRREVSASRILQVPDTLFPGFFQKLFADGLAAGKNFSSPRVK